MRPFERAMVITGNSEKTRSYRQDAQTAKKLKPDAARRFNSARWNGRTARRSRRGNACRIPETSASSSVSSAAQLFLSPRAPDPGAEPRQLLLDALVAAVEVIHAVHDGRAARDEPREDKARRGAQVRRHDVGTIQACDAFHYGGIALDLDVRAEALQLLHVHEAVLEYRFRDDAGAARDGVERHELRLHVGRKRRIGRGADVDRIQGSVRSEGDPVLSLRHVRASLAQLVEHRFQYLRADV